jgi:hypothetical protein
MILVHPAQALAIDGATYRVGATVYLRDLD